MTVITREELEASNGSSIIGFINDGTGATARTVQDKLRDGNKTPQDFGAVGDSLSPTEDQAGFEAVFADAHAPQHGVLLPPGVYDAGGLEQAGGSLYLAAEIPGTVIIQIPEDEYFMTVSEPVANMYVSGIRFVGGKGAFRFANELNNVAGLFVVEDCAFIDYTECAIGNNANDHPYLKVNRCIFMAADEGAAIGIAWGGYFDCGTISDCSFLVNKYHLKLGPRLGGSFHVERCEFQRFTSAVMAADIWIVPNVDADDPPEFINVGINSGEGIRFTSCKFGNEGLTAAENRILIALEGSGDDRLTRHHSEEWQDQDAKAFITGLLFSQNKIIGVGDAAQGAFIYSYIQNFRRLVWIDNQEDSGCYTYLCQFDAIEADEMGFLTRNWRIELGAGRNDGIALFRRICNRGPGVTLDWMGQNQGDALLTHNAGGDSTSYAQLFSAYAYLNLLVYGGASKSDVTDSLGNASRAAEVTLTGTGDPHMLYGVLTTDPTANRNSWIELDLARGTSQSVDYVIVELINAGTGQVSVRTPVTLEGAWFRARIPFTAVSTSSPGTWQLRVYSPDYAVSTRTSFKVGRILVYQSREPMQNSHLRTAGTGACLGEHLVLGAHHLGVGADTALRYKASAFGSASDGLPLAMKVGVPGSSSAGGKPGDWAADSAYIYTYTGDGTSHSWVRSAAATW